MASRLASPWLALPCLSSDAFIGGEQWPDPDCICRTCELCLCVRATQLRGATLTLHTNFLSEGKCSIRLKSPRALALYMSNIATHQLQAAVNLLNAVSDARVKKSVRSSSGLA